MPSSSPCINLLVLMTDGQTTQHTGEASTNLAGCLDLVTSLVEDVIAGSAPIEAITRAVDPVRAAARFIQELRGGL